MTEQQELLFKAIYGNDLETFKSILPNVDINCREPTKNSTPLIKASFKNRIEMVKLLIENGADLDCYSSHNNTALMLASYNNYVDICILLIKAGANIYYSGMCIQSRNKMNSSKRRRTAIHTTIITNALTLTANNKSIDAAKILINAGIVIKENIELAKHALMQFASSSISFDSELVNLLKNAIIKIEPNYIHTKIAQRIVKTKTAHIKNTIKPILFQTSHEEDLENLLEYDT